MGTIDFVVFVFLISTGQLPIVTIHTTESDCDAAKAVLISTYPASVIADCTPIYKMEKSVVKRVAKKRAPVKKKPTQRKR